MSSRFVIDTVAFINYHREYFNERDLLSPATRKLIAKCIDRTDNSHKLIIPSVVFLEIFKKFLNNEELSRKFYYEIFLQLKDAEDVEIKPLEQEVVQILSKLSNDYSLDLHDKIIYSSAAQLQCVLITNDPKIIKAERAENFLEDIIF